MSRSTSAIPTVGVSIVLLVASGVFAAGPPKADETPNDPIIFGPTTQAVHSLDRHPQRGLKARDASRSGRMEGAVATSPAPSVSIERSEMGRNNEGALSVEAEPKTGLDNEGSSQELGLLPPDREGSKALANGLFLDGTVRYKLSSFVEMWADQISNTRAAGTTSGTIRLELWATPDYPVFGTTIFHYTLGGYNLGQLDGGYYWYNIYSGTLTYSPPPIGCYWITMALLEYTASGWVYQDLVTFDSRVGFGTSCSSCTDDLEHGVACLLNGRFKFQMNWTGFDTVTQPVVFVKQSDQTAAGVFQINRNDITLVVKVTNGCGFNGAYWVWLGGFTNAAWNLQVTDTQTGRSHLYTKGLSSTPPVTVKDDSSFSCP